MQSGLNDIINQTLSDERCDETEYTYDFTDFLALDLEEDEL